MAERPETITKRVREWLDLVVDADPARLGSIEISDLLDEVDTGISSSENIRVLAGRFGFPTLEELKDQARRLGRRDQELRAQLEEEQIREQELDAEQRRLIEELRENLPAGATDQLREFIDLQVARVARQFEQTRPVAERVEVLDDEIRKLRRSQERTRRLIRELGTRKLDVRPTPETPAPAPVGAERLPIERVFSGLEAREKALRSRIDLLWERELLQQNERKNFFRLLNTRQEEIRRKFEEERAISPEQAVKEWGDFLDQVDDEVSDLVKARELRRAPTVIVEVPRREELRPPREAPPPREEREELTLQERFALEGKVLLAQLEDLAEQFPGEVKKFEAEGLTTEEIIQRLRPLVGR